MTKPSKKVRLFFSVRSQRSSVKQVVIRYSLVYREDGFLVQFSLGVFAMAPGGSPPQTHSLECTSAQCALGENGAKWRTPEYPLEFAMQMLTMHTETNHKHPQQSQVVNTTIQKHKAEKVNRPTIKMGSSEDDFIFFKCLFESYKRSCQLTDEVDIRDQLLACCETDLRRDLHRYLGTGVDTKSEGELLTEIKRIAVITRSNLVNVVSLMSSSARMR